jgi:hypothetical protein
MASGIIPFDLKREQTAQLIPDRPLAISRQFSLPSLWPRSGLPSIGLLVLGSIGRPSGVRLAAPPTACRVPFLTYGLRSGFLSQSDEELSFVSIWLRASPSALPAALPSREPIAPPASAPASVPATPPATAPGGGGPPTKPPNAVPAAPPPAPPIIAPVSPPTYPPKYPPRSPRALRPSGSARLIGSFSTYA